MSNPSSFFNIPYPSTMYCLYLRCINIWRVSRGWWWYQLKVRRPDIGLDSLLLRLGNYLDVFVAVPFFVRSYSSAAWRVPFGYTVRPGRFYAGGRGFWKLFQLPSPRIHCLILPMRMMGTWAKSQVPHIWTPNYSRILGRLFMHRFFYTAALASASRNCHFLLE